MSRPLIPALAGSLLALPLLAVAGSHETELDTVVVSATRSAQSAVTTPSAITIITREEIAASGASNVVDVLRGQPGLQIHDYFGDGSRAAIGMRGFGGGNAAHNTLVLVDGRRLNNIDLSAPALSTVHLDDIERIEIVQGSAGALFGDMAVGGVINIITRGTGEARSEVSAEVGSFGHKGLQASYSGRYDSGFGVRLSGSSERGDGYRDRSGYDRQNGSVLFDLAHDSGRLFAEFQGSQEMLELAGGIPSTADRKSAQYETDFNDGTSSVNRLGISQSLSDHWMFEGELAHRRADMEGVMFGGSELSQGSRHTLIAPRLIGSYDTARGEVLATIGIDLHANSATLDSSFGSTMATHDVKAFYGQVVIPLSDRLSGTLGVRRATVDGEIDNGFSVTPIDDDATAREVGISFEMNPALRLFARIDENFRFAKSDELTWTDPAADPLATQVGLSREIGADWNHGRLQITSTIYRIELDNELAYSGGYNVNLPANRRNGTTFVWDWSTTDALTLSGGYSYTNAVFTAGSYSGSTMPMVAEHTARISANYRFNNNFSMTTSADHVSDRVLDSDTGNILPMLRGRTILNANLSYSRGPWNAELAVNNLLNTTYSDYGAYAEDWSGGFPPVVYDAYYPAPERSWRLTVGYDF